MKKYKYLLLLMLTFSVIACSDLAEEPLSQLSPEGFYKSVQDVQTAVNGSYAHMVHEDWWGRKMSLTIMLRSDMVDIGNPGTPSRRRDHNAFTVAADNGMLGDNWQRSYQIVGAANEAIAGAELISESVDEDLLNPVKAQGHFMRAFAYYHLVRQFGPIIYLDEPVIDFDLAATLPKTSVDDIYVKIIEDLEYAKTWLPNEQFSRSLPSKATAAAYLASVHLTLGNFQDAYDESKFVIDNESTFGLSLAADYQDLFNAELDNAMQQESLFSLTYNSFSNGDQGRDYQPALTGIAANEAYVNTAGGGWSVAVPNINVYNNWDGRDYRKAVSLDTTAVFQGNTLPYTDFQLMASTNVLRPYIAKYTRYTGLTAAGNGRGSATNYSLMRYAEVLLIAAEALNEVSAGSTEAHGYVNRVRARARNGNGAAFPADVAGLSQDDFRDMVLEERRIELAFEFKRWYDIVRRDLGNEVFGASGLEPQPNFDASRDYLLPIPADELQRNTNLLPNNPGY